MVREEEGTLMGPRKVSRERRGRRGREEKDYERQGLKKKKKHAHTITIIIVMAIIYRALTIFQTVPYPRELTEASERSMRRRSCYPCFTDEETEVQKV